MRSAGKVRYLGIAGGAAPKVFQRHRELFDVFQCPEFVLDAAASVIPDLTYGVMRAIRDTTLIEGETRAATALRRAFARREAGGIIIGTTRLAHLKEYVSAAWLLGARPVTSLSLPDPAGTRDLRVSICIIGAGLVGRRSPTG